MRLALKSSAIFDFCPVARDFRQACHQGIGEKDNPERRDEYTQSGIELQKCAPRTSQNRLLGGALTLPPATVAPAKPNHQHSRCADVR
jgi:hypothetical protein